MSDHPGSSPIDDEADNQKSVASDIDGAIEHTMEIDAEDLILDLEPDDLLPEDDSHLERAIDGPSEPSPSEEILDDDDLEDDDFLEQIAIESMGEAVPPAVPESNEVEDDLNALKQFALDSAASAGPSPAEHFPEEDESLLEQIALESPADSTTPCDLDLSGLGPIGRETAIALDPGLFDKKIEALEPVQVLEKMIKPIRLYTSVPAKPIPDPEFPLT